VVGFDEGIDEVSLDAGDHVSSRFKSTSSSPWQIFDLPVPAKRFILMNLLASWVSNDHASDYLA